MNQFLFLFAGGCLPSRARDDEDDYDSHADSPLMASMRDRDGETDRQTPYQQMIAANLKSGKKRKDKDRKNRHRCVLYPYWNL